MTTRAEMISDAESTRQACAAALSAAEAALAAAQGLDEQPPVHQPPSPPTGLRVKTSPGAAELSWQGVPDATGYVAMYNDPAGVSSPPVPTTDLSVKFTDLAPGEHVFAAQSVRDGVQWAWVSEKGTVPGVTPTPTPPPGGVVDGIPYPPLYATVAHSGDDLAKLSADSTLEDGDYTTSGDISHNVVARNPGKAVLKLKAKQCPQFPDVLAGVWVKGGGLPNTDELKTAGPIAGALTHSCRFSDSEGFGLLVGGGKSRVTQCEIDNNGSGGIGGTGSSMDVLVDNCHIHDNNRKYKCSNSNKFTRGKVVYRNNNVHDNAGVDLWADNYVQRMDVIDNTFKGTQVDHSGHTWTAANVRGEISDNLTVRGNAFNNDITAALSIDEMQVALIEDNDFSGKAKMAAELRNDARGTPPHSLRDITIKGNRYATNDLNIVPSGAGKPISLSGNKISVTSDNVWPDGKIAPHVKVKP